jgi:hypothetical protein
MMNDVEKIQKAMEDAAHLTDLTRHPGWAVFRDECEHRVSDLAGQVFHEATSQEAAEAMRQRVFGANKIRPDQVLEQLLQTKRAIANRTSK